MRELTLEDVCSKITDGAHFSPKDCPDGKYPMFSIKDMQEYGFSYENCKYVSDEDYVKLLNSGCVPEVGDILVAKDGSYLKHVFVVKEKKEEAILSSIAIFRPNELILPEYLLYILKNPIMKKIISDNYVSGSALPRIVLKDFKKIKLGVPEIGVQRKVINILGNIDKKIDLNNKLNANLEDCIDTIYKQMFVDSDEVTQWDSISLKEFAKEIITGKTPSTKREEYYGDKYPFITIPDLHGNVYVTHTERSLSEEGNNIQKGKLLPCRTIVVSCIATVGLVAITNQPSHTNQQINALIPRNDFDTAYIYEACKNMKNILLGIGSTGSTTLNVNKGEFEKIAILNPPEKIRIGYSAIVEPMLSQIRSNDIENIKLCNLRDAILPKIMSGKIDLFEIKV